MEVDPPLLHSTATRHQSPQSQHTPGDRYSSGQRVLTPENFELSTEQIKRILTFGKDLQKLYDSIADGDTNKKLKVLLQVGTLYYHIGH